ncbi:MAG TPA: hypothetical protein VF377_08820 [Acidimicrobiia bacterium]
MTKPRTCAWPNFKCPQPPTATGLCHYHQKLKAGLLQEAAEYLSDTEIDTLFGGRRRSDGRRLDHYTRR